MGTDHRGRPWKPKDWTPSHSGLETFKFCQLKLVKDRDMGPFKQYVTLSGEGGIGTVSPNATSGREGVSQSGL